MIRNFPLFSLSFSTMFILTWCILTLLYHFFFEIIYLFSSPFHLLLFFMHLFQSSKLNLFFLFLYSVIRSATKLLLFTLFRFFNVSLRNHSSVKSSNHLQRVTTSSKAQPKTNYCNFEKYFIFHSITKKMYILGLQPSFIFLLIFTFWPSYK